MVTESAFILVVLVLANGAMAALDPNRVHYIDRINANGVENFIFRGNEPTNSSNMFAYDQLWQTMALKAKTEGNTSLPSDFYLIDFSDIEIEKKFFEKYPSLGQYINWPIVGQLLPPQDVTEKVRKYMAEHLSSWTYDQLPALMAKLNQMLSTKGDKPIVIYVHCEAGEDRTGEVSGSYYIKWLHYSFEKALYIDNHIENRDIHVESRNAFQWYCYYLFYVEKYNLNCELPHNSTANALQ